MLNSLPCAGTRQRVTICDTDGHPLPCALCKHTAKSYQKCQIAQVAATCPSLPCACTRQRVTKISFFFFSSIAAIQKFQNRYISWNSFQNNKIRYICMHNHTSKPQMLKSIISSHDIVQTCIQTSIASIFTHKYMNTSKKHIIKQP